MTENTDRNGRQEGGLRSRRDFLRAAGWIGAGAVAAGCAPEVITKIVKETQIVTVKETEIVQQVIKETVVAPAADKILRFWSTRFFNPKITLAFFEQSQVAGRAAGVTVDVEAISGSFTEYVAKLTAAKEAGTLADIFAPQIGTRQFINNGWMLPITDVWDKVAADNGGWHPIAERNFKVNGEGYALDIGFAPAYLHIRQDLVEAAGFSLPFKDLADMVAFAKTYNKPADNLYGLAFAMGPADDLMHLQPLFWAHGGASFAEDGTITINSSENIAALKWLTDLYTVDKLIPPGATTWDGGGNNQAYLTGASPIIMNPGSPLAAARRKESAVDDLLDKTFCAPWPQLNAKIGPQAQTEAGQAFGINSECKLPDEAKQVLLHIWSPEIYLTMMKEGQGYLFPALQGVYKDDYYTKDRWNKQVVDTVLPIMHDESWAGPPGAWTSLWSTWSGQAVTKVVQDGVTPEAALAEAQKIVEEARKTIEG